MGRKGKKPKKHNPDQLIRRLKPGIIAIFEDNPKKSYNYKQIASWLKITDAPTRQAVLQVLAELRASRVIKETSRGKFSIAQSARTIIGKIEITRRGAGYVVNDEMDDIFIHPSNTMDAFNRDQVEVQLKRRGRDNKLEGKVVRVIERNKKQYVGIFRESKDFAFVQTDDPFMHVDFYISKSDFNGAVDGHKVIIELIDWKEGDDSPSAKVLEDIGEPGDHNTEMHAILAAYDLPYKFPDEVERAADKISFSISDAELNNRIDFRDTLTFTIDPEDAKDFDDALSIKTLDNGNFEIGVHIADVSHYVQPGDLIDQEAYSRATSVYLVDRVVPMLPEVLSNGVCSLRPNEDKLCYSVVFEITDKATVKSYNIVKTIIHSSRRFTYEEAQERIETGKGDLAEEILQMDALAKILRRNRMDGGAMEIASEEVKFRLDEEGKPTEVFQKVSKDANKLIEEFMLLANKYVAMHIGKPTGKTPPKPFIYRVHEPPAADKLERFVGFLKHIGFTIGNLTPDNYTSKINSLLKEMEDDSMRNIISTMAIRTMSKAEYSTEILGHYGLAFRYYSHFTSPIRRYPDLIAHRLLHQYIDKADKYSIDLPEACKHTSNMERVAAEAERESIKYKQVEYMQDKVGLVFSGKVSGLSSTGIFVELLESRCEGMIRLTSLGDDNYQFDERHYVVVGKRTGKEFFLGDPVEVLVKHTDILKKQIDFELVDEDFF